MKQSEILKNLFRALAKSNKKLSVKDLVRGGQHSQEKNRCRENRTFWKSSKEIESIQAIEFHRITCFLEKQEQEAQRFNEGNKIWRDTDRD